MFSSLCSHHYFASIHRLCSLKIHEFPDSLLWKSDPFGAPNVPKQLFQEHPKHAQNIINRETSWANSSSNAGSHRQCMLGEAWKSCIGDWHLVQKRQHVWRKDFVDVMLCIQVISMKTRSVFAVTEIRAHTMTLPPCRL